MEHKQHVYVFHMKMAPVWYVFLSHYELVGWNCAHRNALSAYFRTELLPVVQPHDFF